MSHIAYKNFKSFATSNVGQRNSSEMMPMSGLNQQRNTQNVGNRFNYESPSMNDNIDRNKGFIAFQGSGTQIG